jgi:hypothetical protein
MTGWSAAHGIGPIVTGPIRWPKPSGPYEVTLRFEWIDGRWECTGVDVRAVDAAGAKPEIVTASLLRSLPLGRLIDKHLVTFKTAITTEDIDGTVYRFESDYTGRPKRGGRPVKYGPEHYVEVARTYREAYERRRTPTRAVAARFKVSETAAAKWVAKCRDLGLLPQTTKGKARVVGPTKRKGTRRKKR